MFLDGVTYFYCLNIEKNISAKVVKIIVQNMRVKEHVAWHPQEMDDPEDYRYKRATKLTSCRKELLET